MSAPQRWVLLRGLAREAGHWGRFPDRLRAALGAGHEVRALDLPGNGTRHAQASARTVAGLVAACREVLAAQQGQGSVRLVALSLGAMVALEWACTAAPGELAGCALINTSLGGHSPAWRRLRPATALRLAWACRPGADVQQREQRVLEATSGDPARHAGLSREWAAIAAARPVRPANVLRQLLAAARYRVPARAPEVPLLVLCSQGDRLVSPQCSHVLAQSWGLPLHVHPWAGHDLTLDDPDWVARQLANWAADPRA